jgi:hypothetical protein
MKANTGDGEKRPFRNITSILPRVFIVAFFLFIVSEAQAQPTLPGSGTNSSPTYTPQESWSFRDSTNWTSDYGYAPVSFTNLAYSNLGNGASLVVNSTNQAWLQFNVVETNGATNLTVDAGTVMFWFAPGSWSGTNEGGTGPGDYVRLFEVGAYTTNSSFGWWSLYTDPAGANIYFSAQTNDLSSNVTTYLSAPIAWTTNYFHFVVLTYSTTNTALYLDGVLVTNGPPLTVYPGPDVLANGFYLGSDSNGVYQADGLFNDIVTYNVPLDAATIQEIFTSEYTWYEISPWNMAMYALSSASSSPSYTPAYDAITGQGNLQWVSNTTSCVYGTNAYQVWITNVTAAAAGNGTMTVTFAIQGGQDNVSYDVFANSVLGFPASSSPAWAWMGQGGHCNAYQLTNLPNTSIFIILGTPQDSDLDGLTDAYEKLISHTDPNNPDTSGDGLSDSDKVLLKLNPLTSNAALPSNPCILTCPQ